MYVDDCEFCQQFSGIPTPTSIQVDAQVGTSHLLIRENGVITMAGVGPLTPGYVLICPQDHYYSLAEVPDVLLAEVIRQKHLAMHIIEQEFGSVMCFEHGAVNSRTRGGSCVDHAHLHVIQGALGFRELVRRDYAEIKLEDIRELRQFTQQGMPYLFIEDVDSHFSAYHIPQRIQSQYLRQVWAATVSRQREWDWTLFPNYEMMKATVALFSDKLKT